MKAAVFYGPRDIRFEEVEKPVIGADEILIKVKACGICGSDLHQYKLGKMPQLGLPIGPGRMIMGHEFSGDVVEAGAQVAGIKAGDRVTTVSFGGFAEFVKARVHANGNVLRLPDEVDYEDAATNEPLATSLHAANLASPTEGQIILIAGMGLIGLGLLQVLKARHPNKIIVTDLSEKRRGVAKQLGADIALNPVDGDLFDQLMKILGEAPRVHYSAPTTALDMAVDCAGRPKGAQGPPVIAQILNCVREWGKVVLVGAYEEEVTLNLNMAMGKSLKILGSAAYGPEEMAESLELIRSRKVDRKCLISHRFPLDRTKEAFETQLNVEDSIKVLVKP